MLTLLLFFELGLGGYTRLIDIGDVLCSGDVS
jgi:hypothetical protein